MVHPSYEFHFSTNSRRVRQTFLAAVASSKFFYHVYALDKSDRPTLRGLGITNSESLFRYVIREACNNAKSYLNYAKVVIDGRKGDRKFRNELRSYLSREIRDDEGRRLIGLLRLRDSKKDNLLQLADYVAGVSNRVLYHAPDGDSLHKYLARHEITFQIWPQQ
tara:strand:- start:304 stop:795 length:492 start_codon:yes stop_codon:yes gene_type:complete